jgi:6-phosphogluconate dehydrogenase
MEASFDFGMIGIGVMGSNLLLNMADHGFAVVGFDLRQERADQLEKAANSGTKVKGTTDMQVMVTALKKPRKIMMLVPAGKPVDDVIDKILPLLEPEDILIDGGNSYFKDTLRRITFLQEKKIHFFGMGVSGGELGARLGPSMMPGGDRQAWQFLQPVLEAIAAQSGGVPCVAYMGNNAAGHYVKMVHNGIEYAMMQLISEAYDLLRRGGGWNNVQLQELFSRWNEGHLQSYLISITAEVFQVLDTDTEERNDYLVDKILDKAGSKGTGKWTSQEAMDLPVAIPTIDMAVSMRDLSSDKDLRVQTAGVYGPQYEKISWTPEQLADLESGLLFSFIIAYAQGLSMLAKASETWKMEIPLPDVIRVWKAGCIIRSAVLGNFSEAFAKNKTLPNLLLDKEIAQLLKAHEPALRRTIALGLNARIPMAGLMSALSYYDALLSERLPVNLIQAQRDLFGAHTYLRSDKEGVFHTVWNKEG